MSGIFWHCPHCRKNVKIDFTIEITVIEHFTGLFTNSRGFSGIEVWIEEGKEEKVTTLKCEKVELEVDEAFQHLPMCLLDKCKLREKPFRS